MLSIILATHNRRDIVLATLQRLRDLERETEDCEIIVVDNASTDGTADAIRHRFRDVTVLALPENRGSCAKAFGVDVSGGDLIVFLDDDSYPRMGALDLMRTKFDADPKLGAAGFQIHLPDGRRECSALPDVFVGCGVGLRRSALDDAGGLDPDLFMQAEEYDLTFRLVQAGWTCRVFDDLHADHLKSPQSRTSARTAYYDTRNNLLVAARYLPDPWLAPIFRDWAQRYRWLYNLGEHRDARRRALRDGRHKRKCDRSAYADKRLGRQAFERLFRFDEIDRRLASLRSDGVRSVLLADWGKNILPFVLGARRAEIEVAAIVDDRFAAPGRHYRGIPITTVRNALHQPADAVVISNTAPVHAAATYHRYIRFSPAPIHCWYKDDAATIVAF